MSVSAADASVGVGSFGVDETDVDAAIAGSMLGPFFD